MTARNRAHSLFATAALLLALAAFQPAFAAEVVGADINLSPLRVVFEKGGRSETLFVFNHGDSPATYKIELIDRMMTKDGRLLPVTEALEDPALEPAVPDVHSAKDFIVYTPRRITLAPNESQTIRVQALRPAGLADGEYRTHLTVTAVPPEDTGVTAEQLSQTSKGELAIRIVPVFSLSIPLIVRQGPTDIRALIENAEVLSGAVNAEIVRLGANSVYGDIEVLAGKDVIGVVKGVAVYPEVKRRSVRVPLTRAPNPGEELSLVFFDSDQHPGAELARQSLRAP